MNWRIRLLLTEVTQNSSDIQGPIVPNVAENEMVPNLEMKRYNRSQINKAPEGKHTQYEVCVGTCQLAVGLLACNILLYSVPPAQNLQQLK